MKILVGGQERDVKVLFSAEQIQSRIVSLAADVNNAPPADGSALVVLVVLHGALLFAADLVRHLNMATEIESVRIRSYHGTQSTGKIELLSELPERLKGRHVLVVEDIIDSGRSILFLRERLNQLGVASIRIAALLDKPEAHPADLKADYIGFSIGRNFVIGYGLDLDGHYRNLPHVAEVLDC
ncbi:hypoxanthine phosphoribosyltransferase [bacterium]|nr:hypoxanthine phosphoribosyltransferase [bacterium]